MYETLNAFLESHIVKGKRLVAYHLPGRGPSPPRKERQGLDVVFFTDCLWWAYDASLYLIGLMRVPEIDELTILKEIGKLSTEAFDPEAPGFVSLENVDNPSSLQLARDPDLKQHPLSYLGSWILADLRQLRSDIDDGYRLDETDQLRGLLTSEELARGLQQNAHDYDCYNGYQRAIEKSFENYQLLSPPEAEGVIWRAFVLSVCLTLEGFVSDEPAKDTLWHSKAEAEPLGWYGPIAGTKGQLSYWLLESGNEKAINTEIQSNTDLWARKCHRTRWQVFFKNRVDYSNANARRIAYPEGKTSKCIK